MLFYKLFFYKAASSTADGGADLNVNEDLKQFMSKENLEKEIENIKKATKIKKIATNMANNNYSSMLNVTDLKGKNYVLYDQNNAKKPPPPPLVPKKVTPPARTQNQASSYIIKEKRVHGNLKNQQKAMSTSILSQHHQHHHAGNGSNDVVYLDFDSHQYQYTNFGTSQNAKATKGNLKKKQQQQYESQHSCKGTNSSTIITNLENLILPNPILNGDQLKRHI